MIRLDVADLVVIAGQTLGLDLRAALGAADVTAAETALAEARDAGRSVRDRDDRGRDDRDGDELAAVAAGLLRGLIVHRPFRDGYQQVAFVAMTQFLAMNGWQADLDPPEAVQAVMAGLAAGTLDTADAAAWLSPRLVPPPHREPRTKEGPMPRLLSGRRRQPSFHRFTDRARRVVVLAQHEARGFNHNYIGTEHILLGLVHEGDGVAARALESMGISLADVRQQVEQIIGQGRQAPLGRIPFTPRAKKVLELSLREALQLGHTYIGTEHILLGLIREGQGLAAQILVGLGADMGRAREQVIMLVTSRQAAPGEHVPPPGERVPPPGLGDYDEKIAAARQQKDTALDDGDFDRAAALRGEERRLLDERARRLAQWSEGTDVAALAGEIDRLHQEVARLRGLLARNGIQPGEGHQQTA
jgi:prophage maintenance system killer protein